MPERLEIQSIGIPPSNEHFAPTKQETQSAIDLLNLMVPSDIDSPSKMKPKFTTGNRTEWEPEFVDNEDALSIDSKMIDRNPIPYLYSSEETMDPETSLEAEEKIEDMKNQLSRSIAAELDNIRSGLQGNSGTQPEPNEWDALKEILQDAGVGIQDIKGLMTDLEKDESISIELKKAFNHWLKTKDAKKSLKSFKISESIWRKIETFLLVEKYSISSKLL